MRQGTALVRDILTTAGLLAALCILSTFRFLDGNTLASWRWTLTEARLPWVAGAVAGAAVACRFLARFCLAGGRTGRGREALLAAGAVLLPAVLLAQQPQVLLDAGRYLVQATYLERYGPAFFFQQWGRAIPAWTDQPLGAVVYGLAFSFFGKSQTVILATNAAALFLTLLLTRGLGQHLLSSRDAGWTAALMLVGSPYLLVQLPLVLVDILTMLAMTLALLLTAKALAHGGRHRLATAGLAVALALMAKYSTWPMLLGLPLLAPLAAPAVPARTLLRRGTAIALAASGAILPYTVATWPLAADQLRILATYQRQGLATWQEGPLSIFFFQTCPLLAPLAAAAVWRSVQRRAWRYLGLCWFAGFALLFHAWRLRYLLPLLPLFALLAALGLQQTLADRRGQRFVALLAACWGIVIATIAYLPFFRTTSMANLQEAAAAIDRLEAPAVEVLFLPQLRSSGSTAAAVPLLGISLSTPILCRQEWPGDRQEAGTREYTPLRFTRELERPLFYRPEAYPSLANTTLPLAVLSPLPLSPQQEQEVQAARRLTVGQRFLRSSGVFRYQTVVTLFLP